MVEHLAVLCDAFGSVAVLQMRQSLTVDSRSDRKSRRRLVLCQPWMLCVVMLSIDPSHAVYSGISSPEGSTSLLTSNIVVDLVALTSRLLRVQPLVILPML